MKKLLLVLILIGGGIVGGVYVYDRWMSTSTLRPRPDEYRFLPVQRGRVVESVSVTGLLQPPEVALVSSEMSGRVVHIFPEADYNRAVRKGDALLQLDDRLARRKLAQAQAALQTAEADIARAQALVEAAELSHRKHQEQLSKGVGLKIEADRSAMELKAARAALQVAEARRAEAEAAIQLAQVGVDMTTLRAPVDGIIIEKKVVLGQGISGVQPTPLFYIARDLKTMQVHAQVPEADIGKVRVGMKATFTVTDTTQPQDQFESAVRRFDGRVTEIRPMPTNLQGAVFYTAIIEVENQKIPGTDSWFLRPGMSVYTELIFRQHEDVWLMPMEALDFKLDPAFQGPEAREKLARWESRLKEEGTFLDWKHVWILDEQDRPWPIFVRISGTGDHGEEAFRGAAVTPDTANFGEFQEILEWDPDPKIQQLLKPADPAKYPKVITEAPEVESHSLFEPPSVPRVF